MDNSTFSIKFNPPQNFAQYRQTEMDQARVGTYVQLTQIPFLSKRFALKRFLGLSEEEMAQNSTLWSEENNIPQKKQTKTTQLRTAGVSQSDIQSDLEQFENPTPPEGAPEPGTAPAGPGANPAGTPGTTPGGGATT